MKLLMLLIIGLASGLITPEVFAAKSIVRTPEQEALFIGKYLKPVSDEAWKNAAGSKSMERYGIIKGDTLYDISKRLFGDSKYWPKIWAINNQEITNPHRIRPGNLIAFSPGTGSSLPTVAITANKDLLSQNTSKTDPNLPSTEKASATDAPSDSPVETAVKRSMEWKNLPKQSWENYRIDLSPEVDPLGFDKRNKIVVQAPVGFESQALPTSEEIKFLGQIIGSRSESEYLSISDLVYIHAEEALETGKVYTITQDPSILKSSKSDRIGYSYLMLGKVKILGVKENLFVGRILTARGFVPRGTYIIPEVPKVPELSPIPGPQPLEGVLLVDHNFSTFTTAQHKEVFVNRGTDDGVQPGMIFRVYQHYDPGTDKKVSKKNFIIDADLMITQVSPKLSTAMIIHNHSPVVKNSTVILLTDLSDLGNNDGFNLKPGADDNDDLDHLDDKEGLDKDGQKELKQLEEWKGNPSPTPSEAAPLPEEGNPPPPPPLDSPEPSPNNESQEPPKDSEVPPPPPLESSDDLTPPPTTADPTSSSPTTPEKPPADASLPPPPPSDPSEPAPNSEPPPTPLDEPPPLDTKNDPDLPPPPPVPTPKKAPSSNSTLNSGEPPLPPPPPEAN